MPYIYTKQYAMPSYEQRYAFPIQMIEDNSLSYFSHVGRCRPVIMGMQIGKNPEAITEKVIDADDGLLYDRAGTETWFQQCWLLPDMSIQSNTPTLSSYLEDDPINKSFGSNPWAYDGTWNPTSVYKIVRKGTYAKDIAKFDDALRYGWGYNATWTNGAKPGVFVLDLKSLAQHIYNNRSSSAIDYGRVIVDFIGLDNLGHTSKDFTGNLGFLKDAYIAYSGGVRYLTSTSLCGTDYPSVSQGIDLSEWIYTNTAVETTSGHTLALHLNLLGFNIPDTANDSGSLTWVLTPVATGEKTKELPQRACIRISIVAS